jgi:hypothetical protein
MRGRTREDWTGQGGDVAAAAGGWWLVAYCNIDIDI